MRDCASHKLHAAPGAFVIVENAGAAKQAPLLAIYAGHPMSESLSNSVGVPGLDRGGFILWGYRGIAKHLATGGLQKPYSWGDPVNGIQQFYNGHGIELPRSDRIRPQLLARGPRR